MESKKSKSKFMMKVLATAVSISLITACGGSGGGGGGGPSGPTILSGVFIDGSVEGLAYETDTQSGLTNAEGEFQYIQGEIVSFSLGGIELGSATGQSQITPFDFFGMEAPATELALRQELANYSVITDFHRVANIARLLVHLDNDSDPNNGLDLSGWDTALTGASLDFSQNLIDFVYDNFETFLEENNIANDNNEYLPLVHFYESLGITVPIHSVATSSHDDGNDGTVDEVTEIIYDSEGHYTGYTRDEDNDGNIDRSYSYTFNSLHKIIEYLSYDDSDDDGVFDRERKEVNSYNSDGLYSGSVYTVDDGYDGTADDIYTYSITHDDYGNVITYLRERDTDGDGTNDEIELESNTYENNRLMTRLTEDDDNNDGVIDRRVLESYEYDAQGNRTVVLRQTDTNADDIYDSEYYAQYTFTYDAAGNIVSQDRGVDYDNDGTFDSLYRNEYTYDDNNRELTYYYESDSDADGAINYIQGGSYTYDGEGKRVTRNSYYDSNGDGINSSESLHSYTYDANGFLVFEQEEEDSNADGFIDAIETKAYIIDEFGNRVSELQQSDFDNDGIIDSEDSTINTFTEIENGLLNLLLWYWD